MGMKEGPEKINDWCELGELNKTHPANFLQHPAQMRRLKRDLEMYKDEIRMHFNMKHYHNQTYNSDEEKHGFTWLS